MKMRQHMNTGLGTLLLTTGLALAYASSACAELATAVVEEKQSGRAKGGWSKECAIKAQYPTDAASPLAKTINAYINEALGGSYKGDVFDVKAMAAHYIAECLKPGEDDEDRPADMPPGEEKTEIGKLAETDAYVTYEVSTYGYYGGAHGGAGYDGMTFRKSDGRRMGWDAFVNTDDPGFQHLIKQGLMAYFQAKTDKELMEFLILDEGAVAIPRPESTPLFTREGVKLTYGQYEIAPYAAGMPQFVVPYAEIAPYLTPEARAMVGLDAAASAASAGAASSSWSAAPEEEEEVEETDDPPATVSPGRLTEARHRQFLRESAPYRAADARLNAAWKQVKTRLSPQRYQQVLAEQRAWVRRGRDAAAARLSGLSPVEAFTRVTEERARELEDL